MAEYDVTPELIRKAATDIDEHVAEYDKAVTDFYSQMNSLQGTVYSGEAADALKQKAEEFRDDFTKMKQRMTAYANYLRNAAATYENADKNVAQQAKALRS